MDKNIKLNKFVLYAFNCFVYNYKISGLLVTNTFLGFPEYYTSEKILRKVSMRALQLYFLKIIFKDIENKKTAKKFIFFDKFIMIPIFVFDNYYYQDKKL